MSPRPAKPVVGSPIRASFGSELVAYAREQMEFVRTPRAVSNYEIANVAGTGTWQQVELPLLPANDPKVKYAVILVVTRCATTGDNVSLQLAGQAGAPLAAISYNNPTAGRGGAGGPFLVPVGGTNGRSIWWNATATISRIWITSLGYWRLVG